MTIRHTKMLRGFNPTLKPKEDTSICIACYVIHEWTPGFSTGLWHYRKYHFTPNKRTKMVKLKTSYWMTSLPMTSLNRYGIETIIKNEKIFGTEIPNSIIREMAYQLQIQEVNWMDLEKSWVNKGMMQSMKVFYTENGSKYR